VEILDPDIFVKGSEYTADQLKQDYPSLKNVCLIQHATVSSTTGIIDKSPRDQHAINQNIR
jgi:bifunctional ADP-heptose synthase (sugar kinase/adenylyltransferase)